MSPLRRTLVALALCQAGCAFAGDVFIIANGVAGMTPEEVKEVFLGELQFAGSVKLQPVDNVDHGAPNAKAPRSTAVSGKWSYRTTCHSRGVSRFYDLGRVL